jgi:hypothetical protein
MEQVRLRSDRLSGQAGIAEARRIIGHWLFLLSAIASAAGDETISAHTGRGRGAGQARSTQDLATINRHAGKLPQAVRIRLYAKRSRGLLESPNIAVEFIAIYLRQLATDTSWHAALMGVSGSDIRPTDGHRCRCTVAPGNR